MKYKNLKELRDAYRSGKLKRSNAMMLDNDTTFVYVGDKCVYLSDGPSALLPEALDLLGIPSEHV